MKNTSVAYPEYNLHPVPPLYDGMGRSAAEIVGAIRLGMNIGDALESIGEKPETAWGNPKITPAFIRFVKDQGFNAVRLPVSWNEYATVDTARIQPEWLERVAEVIGYCIDNDLFVVVNIHWDGGWIEDHVDEASAPEVIARLRAFWQQIATALRDFDQRLLFAGMNEPKVESAEQMAVLMRYHQAFIDAVRSTGGRNAFRTLVLAGPTTDIAKTVQWFDHLPTDSVKNRLALEFHYYTPWNFTGLPADTGWMRCFHYWGRANHSHWDSSRNAAWGEEEELSELFCRIADKARALGVPLILGEYSARNRTYDENADMPVDIERHISSLAYYTEAVASEARKHGIAAFYWDNGVLLDRRYRIVREGMVLAALRRGAGIGQSTRPAQFVKTMGSNEQLRIVNLSGGLGNQMFQYALARQLSRSGGQKVVLNPARIDNLRHFGLDHFSTCIPLVTADEMENYSARRSQVHAINESLPGYVPSVLEAQDAPIVVWDGFWQSEQYFQDVCEFLREDFSLKDPLPPGIPNLKVLQRPNSVCLHVRLGDYLRREGSFMGFVGLGYYRQAIAQMVERVPDAHFFVFSDDLGWCMETLQIDYPHTFIDYDPGPTMAAVALTVMSHCTHFVISNSTFAWWAAWLGKAADKIVIAPKGWFANERGGPNTAQFGSLSSKDTIPPSWLRV
ncbi:cellulase family glycosylhydrolase [Roseateles sp.]|uniref:cellulase family glycosylhydrolase n=1 Tax=Roseateles sp. TaxID=1971397 RepID=UPI003266E01D